MLPGMGFTGIDRREHQTLLMSPMLGMDRLGGVSFYGEHEEGYLYDRVPGPGRKEEYLSV